MVGLRPPLRRPEVSVERHFRAAYVLLFFCFVFCVRSFVRSFARSFSFVRFRLYGWIKKYVPRPLAIYPYHTNILTRKRRTAIALDHAATPAQFPAVGVDVWEVVVVEEVVLEVDDEDDVLEEEEEEVLEEEVVVVGAEAPPVSAFFAETSYRPFASQT